MALVRFLIPTLVAPAVLVVAAQLASVPGRITLTYVTFPLLLLAWAVVHFIRGRRRG
jgi:hypothetical protein